MQTTDVSTLLLTLLTLTLIENFARTFVSSDAINLSPFVHRKITHFSPIFHFQPPENVWKPLVFYNDRNGNIEVGYTRE